MKDNSTPAEISEYRRGLAWKAGQKARSADKGRETCNRERGTIYYDDWQDGWMHEDERLWREARQA